MGQLNCVAQHKSGERMESQKCLPEQMYQRFPERMKKPAFSLLLEKFVFPPQDYERYIEHQESGFGSRIHSTFWWCDARFPPNDDSVLFVTGEPLEQTFMRRDSTEPPKPSGKIKMLKLNDDGCEEELFTNCISPVYPRLSMHPSGSYIGLADDRAIRIAAIHGREGFIKELAGANSRSPTECLSIAFASDGRHVARLVLRYLDDERLNSLGFHVDKFELTVSVFEDGHLSCDKAVNLGDKVPRFYSDTMQDRAFYIEHMNIKWSPDSKFIATCSPRSCSIFSQKLKLFVNVLKILKFGVFDSYGYKFDFDPRSGHHLLAVSTNDNNGTVYFVSTKSKQVLKQSAETESEIEYLLYHPSGKYVAAATQKFNIYLVDPDDGSFLHHIDMRAQCSSIPSRFSLGPSFTGLCFTSSGEQLVTATSDAKVRIFRVTIDMSLYSFCKWAILAVVPQTKLNSLPLPQKLISELILDHTC